MYKHLSRFLTENEIKNYSIGQHQGKCTSPFVVISDEGENGITGYSITYREIDLIILYPMGKYSQLEDYIEKVKDVMSGYKRGKWTRRMSDVIIDNEKEAYIVALTYRVYRGL